MPQMTDYFNIGKLSEFYHSVYKMKRLASVCLQLECGIRGGNVKGVRDLLYNITDPSTVQTITSNVSIPALIPWAVGILRFK